MALCLGTWSSASSEAGAPWDESYLPGWQTLFEPSQVCGPRGASNHRKVSHTVQRTGQLRLGDTVWCPLREGALSFILEVMRRV